MGPSLRYCVALGEANVLFYTRCASFVWGKGCVKLRRSQATPNSLNGLAPFYNLMKTSMCVVSTTTASVEAYLIL